MNFKFVTDLKNHLVSVFGGSDFEIAPEKCPPEMNGDITINCFRFARPLGKSPDQIGEAALKFLSDHPDVEFAEKIKAFVNVTIRPVPLFRDSLASLDSLMRDVALPQEKRRRVLVEYSAPNTNKPQHLGHVRNNTIGMALVALLKRAGNDVVPINLVNDRGIHICKSMIAYERFGNGVTPESAGRKGDHLVGDFYVLFNKELEKQLSELKKSSPELAGKSDEELFLQTELGAAAQKMLQDWEAGDPKVTSLWRTMNSWVFKGFEQTYARMGVSFFKTYLESDTYLLGKDFVQKGLDSGVFARREDGAVHIDLGKMGKKVLLRSDGTSVYITQDLGTTFKKYQDFTPDSQIWVVGDEQILHFKMLFEILKKMGYAWADNLHHLAYGMVNLPSGKMKSREGTVVDADDLFDEMASLARTAALERANGNVPADIDTRAETIGMGALKFMLLKFNPKTTMMFDPEASMKFEGDTGPYVQYACARINSIQRKAEERGFRVEPSSVDWGLLSSKEEKDVAVTAYFYPQIIRQAAEKLDCSILVEYLLSLAKSFNRFYREHSALNAEDEKTRAARLALCFACRDILADGLKTLTIGVPDSM